MARKTESPPTPESKMPMGGWGLGDFMRRIILRKKDTQCFQNTRCLFLLFACRLYKGGEEVAHGSVFRHPLGVPLHGDGIGVGGNFHALDKPIG